MARAIEVLFTLLQLTPIFVLSISSNPLRAQLAQSRREQAETRKGETLTQMKEDLAKNVPVGWLGDSDEIAKAVAFLASDEASYVSGIEPLVDGGVEQI